MTSWVLDEVKADELIKEIQTKVLPELCNDDRLFVEIQLLRG